MRSCIGKIAAFATAITIATSGCGGSPALPANSGDFLTGADDDEHFLEQPTGDAEELLGREVTPVPEGGFLIADARTPGCEVAVRREASSWTRKQQQAAERVAGFSLNVSKMGKLLAKYKGKVRLVVQIRNEEVLHADLRGTCGDQVITSVKVGAGARELQYQRDARGGAEGGWSMLGAGLDVGSSEILEGSLSWDRPQAWAFTVGRVADANSAEIRIRMPEQLRPGDKFEPEITAGERDLWLVVVSCDGANECAVLRPSSKIPTEVVPAGQTVKLWPMEAIAAANGHESREKMIVYGFPDKGDFDRFAPPAGALDAAEVTKYLESLRERLETKQEIPARRWTRTEFHFIVETRSADSQVEKNDASR